MSSQAPTTQHAEFIIQSTGSPEYFTLKPKHPVPLLPPLFFAWGNPEVLDSPRAAVLNSRKPRQPRPEDQWVRVTTAMAERVVKDGRTLVASLGANHWDLPAYVATSRGGRLLAVCDDVLPVMRPEDKRDEFFRRYGGLLPPERTLILSPFSPGRPPGRIERRQRRDEAVVGLADMILAVELRAEGNMARLIDGALKRGAPVFVFRPERFDGPTGGNKTLLEQGARPWIGPLPARETQPAPHLAGPVSSGGKAPRIRTNLDHRDWLLHFTRRCPGPWPGQNLCDYYESLARGDENAGHTAFDTLGRILGERRLRASGRLIRGGHPSVSFTARDLSEVNDLLYWRAALARWNVEPYGLALDRRRLFALGARPVIYGDEGVWGRLPEGERHRFQLHRPPGTAWKGEREWRLPGDLDLGLLGPGGCLIIAPTLSEAEELGERHGLEAVRAGGFALRQGKKPPAPGTGK
ncbi:MAG: DNA-processing protein DprA [Thermodesulfobacteriota bacterium]